MSSSPPADTPLLDGWTRAGLWLALVPVLAWASVSLTELTHAASVPWKLAWIPAAATDGVMVVATRVCLRHGLDSGIRRYAAALVVLGAGGSIIAASAQHFLAAQGRAPSPLLAAALGGLPSLMAALLVHIIVMIGAQARREAAQTAERLTTERERERTRAAVEHTEVRRVPEQHTQPARHTSPVTASVTRIDARHRSTASTRQAWIAGQLDAGRDVTGADVKAQFPDAQNGARDVATVLRRRTDREAS